MHDEEKRVIEEIHRASRKALLPIATEASSKLRPMPEIRAVVFDIYGTLLISGSGDVGTAETSSHKQIFQEALERSGAGPVSAKTGRSAEYLYFRAISASHERSRGAGTRHPEVRIRKIWLEVLQGLYEERLIAHAPSEKLAVKVSAFYETIANPVALMPEAAASIAALHRIPMLLGIVSNAQFYTQPLLECELGGSLDNVGFDMDLCSFSFECGCAKPCGAIFSPVLDSLRKRHGVMPAQVLYVGNDMLNDVYTASQAGCRTCLFAGDRRSLRLREGDERCADLKPDITITSLSQLPPLLGR